MYTYWCQICRRTWRTNKRPAQLFSRGMRHYYGGCRACPTCQKS